MTTGAQSGRTRKGRDRRYGRGFDVFLYLSPEESAYIRKQAARTRRAPGEVLRSVITYCTADALEALRQTKIDHLLNEERQALLAGEPVPEARRTKIGMPDVPLGPTTPRVHVASTDEYTTVIQPPSCRIFLPRGPGETPAPIVFPPSPHPVGIHPDDVLEEFRPKPGRGEGRG